MRLIGPASSIETYALIDDGSTVSLLDARLAEKIGAVGLRVQLMLRGINGEEAIAYASQTIDCKIAGVPTGSEHVLRGLFTISNLSLPTQSLTQQDTRELVHLYGIEF